MPTTTTLETSSEVCVTQERSILAARTTSRTGIPELSLSEHPNVGDRLFGSYTVSQAYETPEAVASATESTPLEVLQDLEPLTGMTEDPHEVGVLWGVVAELDEISSTAVLRWPSLESPTSFRARLVITE